jgi:hypothetical protein
MRLALIIIAVTSLLAFILFYFTMEPARPGRAGDLPWQVRIPDPTHSEVFGLVLNTTTLEQARQHFGQLDGLALFQDKRGRYTLEAYFGKVSIGPFSARLIANLDASQQDLETMSQHSVQRTKTEQGGYKWILQSQQQSGQGFRKIRNLTYIPGYKGMDAKFLIERFGEPSSRKSVDDTTELWFYPERGIRIMLDKEGREVFEYAAPAQFNQLLGGGE